MRLLLTILTFLILNLHASQVDRPMKIGANLWIGYSPLYYADAKGWLRKNNIEFVETISLGESLKYYKLGSLDMVCATNYEFSQIFKASQNRGRMILLDKSYGGDMILSNLSIKKLKKAQKISVFLEKKSVNTLLLNEFIHKYKFDTTKLTLINTPPNLSASLRMKTEPTMVVTYDPYNFSLEKSGYKVIASTKDNDFLIRDEIYAPPRTQKQFAKEIDSIDMLVAKALKVLESNPKEYFEAINPTFHYKNYDEFQQALKDIKWIYNEYKI